MATVCKKKWILHEKGFRIKKFVLNKAQFNISHDFVEKAKRPGTKMCVGQFSELVYLFSAISMASCNISFFIFSLLFTNSNKVL